MTKYGMVINLNRCIGCKTCVVACKMQNNVPMDMLWNRVINAGARSYDDAVGSYPNLIKQYTPVACQHCENPPCQAVCPVGATHTDEFGRVLIDYDVCIGCRICMAACPYNARVFNWSEPVRVPDFDYGQKEVAVRPVGVVEKCTLCAERTSEGKDPMCVSACPSRARTYGDLDDPESAISLLIRDAKPEHLLPEKGTSPKIYYIT